MSRLKRLLHVANPSMCNTQQNSVQPCKVVAQHTHTAQQALLQVARPSARNTQQAALEERVTVISDLQQSPYIPAAAPTIALDEPDNLGAGAAEAEARRQRLLAMLAEHPEARYALVTDLESDPEAVILAIAIRGRATCEFQIPREKYDGILLMELIEKHCGTLH